MALSFDDQILGEKVDNYCSSSEDEDESKLVNEDESLQRSNKLSAKVNTITEERSIGQCNAVVNNPGYSVNTGPKGVMEDWRQFKEMEAIKKIEEQNEIFNLYRNLSLGCKTNRELEQLQKDEEEFKDLLEGIDGIEDILNDFREKRMDEMRKLYLDLPTFSTVNELNSASFINDIDNEHKQINIIIHLYEPGISACESVKGCFVCLAEDYPHVKFCNMRATEAKMSEKFVREALPALIIYRSGELIGNLIQVDRLLGDDFFANDMENLLKEYGFIPDKATDLLCKLATVRQTETKPNPDFDID